MLSLPYSLKIILFILILIIVYFKYCYSYWKKRNVKTIPPTIPFGNLAPFVFQQRSIGEQVTYLYNELKKTGETYAGIYMFARPTLLVLDPELCRNVMSKDFQNFYARGTYFNLKDEPLTGHLLNLNGNYWKNIRSKLSPSFTAGKMKMMFDIVVAQSEELEKLFDKHAEAGKMLEAKDIMSRLLTDVIGSCAFGIDCNSLVDVNNEFRTHSRKISENTFWDVLKIQFANQYPRLFSMLGMKRLSKDTSDFFMRIVRETIKYRETNNVSRNDFLQLLMEMKSNDNDDYEKDDSLGNTLTMNELSAQALLFFVAGFDTSSITLSSFLYEMAVNQDIQDKLRNEITSVLGKYDGKITYDAVYEMPYLNKVLEETMRIHSVAHVLARRCTENYRIPKSDFTVEKGTYIVIPVRGFHMDSEFYPDPERFDPERFDSEEKAKRHPFVHIPFGAGPRNCIGYRFAMMQMKVAVSSMLRGHRFTLNSKTITPIKLSPASNLHSIYGGIWLNVHKVK